MIDRSITDDFVVLDENGIRVSINRSSLVVHVGQTDEQAPILSDVIDICDTESQGAVLDRRPAILPLLFGTDHASVGRPRLGRLTINISNACNLVCSYCYADHGLYHAGRSLMSVDRARAIVDRVTGMYGRIETVHLFGGEPLMNVNAIDAIGEAFEHAVAAGRLPAMPKFVATTNGTLSGTRVVAALRRWGIALTVSWDGPDAIHDAVRPTANGNRSSLLLRRSLDVFRAAGIPVEFECTFSRAHVDAGVSVVDLMEFFAGTTDDRTIHIAPAFLPDNGTAEEASASSIFDPHADWQRWAVSMGDLVPQYRAAARATIDNIIAGHGPLLEFSLRIIEQIDARRASTSYCPAFFNQLSIATDGSAFPCFMFIGDDRFRLGNILSDTFPTAESRRVFKRYFDEFGDGSVGSDAWYAPLASGCIAGDAIVTNSFGRRALGPIFEAMAEECLMGIGRHSSRCPDMVLGPTKETVDA